MRRLISLMFLAVTAAAAQAPATPKGGVPTVAEAKGFLARASRVLDSLSIRGQRAAWVQENFITDDTEILNAEASRDLGVAVQKLATESNKFDKTPMTAELRRQFLLLRLSLSAPPPADAKEATELSNIAASLDADYGKGSYCKPPRDGGTKQNCRALGDLSNVLASSRDPNELLDAWAGWHTISRPMRERYVRFVDLSNKGARGLGFADAGAMWRSGYDMPADQFAKEVDRAWAQLRPLYLALHAYTRTKLNEKYGSAMVKPDGPIPAHLLGNMWSQEWTNIYDLLAPAAAAPGVNITEILKAKNIDELEMVHYGERFFTSLGFAKLPETFWKRSLFLKPRDRDVVCHASAWDIDAKNDVRIKLCIERTAEDFQTIHHELGHNFYQRAYASQPFLYQNGANDGFHEAIGDAIALSVTPKYLMQVGLISAMPPAAGDTLQLLKTALRNVAFLPFGLLVDQWRWKVFSGEVKPAEYNKAWWDLKLKYQGVVPPVARSESDFDPGAKYHVASNTPYMRYFLAQLYEFQFYRAMCRAAGHTGPLYSCSFYGSKEAGAKLAKMLEAGQSRPWQEILYEMTGSRTIDASAMAEYFAPLKVWLDRQNAGHPSGW